MDAGEEVLDTPVAAMLGHFGSPSFAIARHRHRALQLNLVERGQVTFVVGGRAHRLRPRSMLWIFSLQDHFVIDQTADLSMWFAYAPRALLSRVCTTPATRLLLARRPPDEVARVLSSSAMRTLAAIFADATERVLEPARYRAALVYTLLTAWDLFLQSDAVVIATELHAAVEHATQMLSAAETEALDLPTLARRCGLSASRLSRLFHAQVGVAIPEFRNRQRIDRFLRAYGSGQRLNLTEAALAAGFETYSQFQRAFAKVMHTSPSEYRRKSRSS